MLPKRVGTSCLGDGEMSRGIWNKLVMLITVALLLGLVYATPQYSQDTAQPCIICHPQSLEELGPAGKYYKEKGTLEGYGELPRKEEKKVLGGECTVCHAQLEPNPEPRVLEGGPPNHRFEFKHGRGRFWCFACHDPVNRDKLRLLNGTTIDLEDYILVCAQCHEVLYYDWQDRLHGKWVGSWQNGKPEKGCIDCHYQHDPAFRPIQPEKPPEKPAERKKIPYYSLSFFIVLSLSIGLAIYAAWR